MFPDTLNWTVTINNSLSTHNDTRISFVEIIYNSSKTTTTYEQNVIIQNNNEKYYNQGPTWKGGL